MVGMKFLALRLNAVYARKYVHVRAGISFFQAEDCIRDHCVTGVQTCALPISRNSSIVASQPQARTTARLASEASPEMNGRKARGMATGMTAILRSLLCNVKFFVIADERLHAEAQRELATDGCLTDGCLTPEGQTPRGLTPGITLCHCNSCAVLR